MRHRQQLSRVFMALGVFWLGGCASQPKIPADALALRESSLETRSMQSRRFPVASEEDILNASIAVLQDMQFNIDEFAAPLGVLTASKNVDAGSAVEFGTFLLIDTLCVLSGQGTCGALGKAADEQKILLTLVVQPSLSVDGDYVARVTLLRVIFDLQQRVSGRKRIEDPAIYQEIFANLSKSLALEENL